MLISISLLPFMLFAQETPWESIPWGNGSGKPEAPAGKAWIIPVVLAPVAATAAVVFWPSGENEPEDPCTPVPLLLLDFTPPSGPGTPDGSFVAAVDPPGNGPYVFTLNGQDPVTSEEPVFFGNGLVAGTYLLEVTDANGCKGSLSVILQVLDYNPDTDKDLERILARRRHWHVRLVFTPLFIRPPAKVGGGS